MPMPSTKRQWLSPDDAWSIPIRNPSCDVYVRLGNAAESTHAPPTCLPQLGPGHLDARSINALDSLPKLAPERSDPSRPASIAGSLSPAPSTYDASDFSGPSSPSSSSTGSLSLPQLEAPSRFALDRAPWRRSKAKVRPQPPLHTAQRLPSAASRGIFQHLQALHETANALSCPTCAARDLVHAALVCRAWRGPALSVLYQRICIDGPDASNQMHRTKLRHGARLKLLRRTLRAQPMLAAHVRELRIWHPQLEPSLQTEFFDLMASVVMACPNLESLSGSLPPYTHDFTRLNHALSTRRHLRSLVRTVGENELITERSFDQLPPGLMDSDQMDLFKSQHTHWPKLDTLVLVNEKEGVLEHACFQQLFRHLPSLRHLSVSNFHVDDFNDHTLLALPALESLRLSRLPGISGRGLARFADSESHTHRLQSLTVIHLLLDDLLLLSRILAALPLRRFALVQDIPPSAVPGSLMLTPVFSSTTLEHLLWDLHASELPAIDPDQRAPNSTESSHLAFVAAPDSGSPSWDLATSHLATSIRAGAFPQLRSICAPADDGTLQQVCAPRHNVARLRDRYAARARLDLPGFDLASQRLRLARLRSQARIDAATHDAGPLLLVQAPDGQTLDMQVFPAWCGTVGSRVHYVLDEEDYIRRRGSTLSSGSDVGSMPQSSNASVDDSADQSSKAHQLPESDLDSGPTQATEPNATDSSKVAPPTAPCKHAERPSSNWTGTERIICSEDDVRALASDAGRRGECTGQTRARHPARWRWRGASLDRLFY